MQGKDFNDILAEQIRICNDTLASKAEEYANERDRLHNFKKAAHLRNQSPREALGGMMVKHTVSIYDMIDNKILAPLEQWDEKITDNINYLILLKAAVYEEYSENQIEIDRNEVAYLREDPTGGIPVHLPENGKPNFIMNPLS